jgi:hypothetical protein
MLSFYVKFALPVVFVIAAFQGMLMSKAMFLFPIGFLVLFLPGLKLHWKIILIGISLLITIVDGYLIGTRSLIFKFGLPLLLLFFYYFRHIFESNQFIKIAHKIFMFGTVGFIFPGSFRYI